jgi:hypothetical protein
MKRLQQESRDWTFPSCDHTRHAGVLLCFYFYRSPHKCQVKRSHIVSSRNYFKNIFTILVAVARLKGAPATQPPAKGQDEDIASTEFNDGEDQDMSVFLDPASSFIYGLTGPLPIAIVWNICSPFSRFVVSVTTKRRSQHIYQPYRESA